MHDVTWITLLDSVSLYARSGASVYGMERITGAQAWSAREALLEDRNGGSVYEHALAAQVRAQRAVFGVTRKELAVMSGVPERTLTRIEAGTVSPKADQIARIVWSLSLSLADFYAGVETLAARELNRG